jgi:hypothetical protein
MARETDKRMESVLTSRPEEKNQAVNSDPAAFTESSPRSGELGALAGVPLFMGRRVQAKLMVGAPDDPLEREADMVANRVVQGGTASVLPASLPPPEEEQHVQAKSEMGANSQPHSAPAALDTSGGAPLPGGMRNRIEEGSA